MATTLRYDGYVSVGTPSGIVSLVMAGQREDIHPN
jgi:hypothetical protein